MGCNFGKDHVKDIHGCYSPQKSSSSVSEKVENQNTVNSRVGPLQKTAKYEARIDKRVADKYDIKALVGKGTFSEVLRVESKESRQPFAIKILKIQSDLEKQLSTSELSALAKISHQFVVKLEEVIISRGVIYLVMQLATGGELYDRIKSRGHFDEKYSCHITQMLLEATAYLHSNGIIHRDLKPENILFYHPGKDSKILITDFGFAKVKTGGMYSDYATTWCGTPEYIAPELIQRLPYDSKVDLWALGVIVYIMLSGHLPFSAPCSPKLFNLIMNGIYSFRKPVWRGVSDSAKDFISNLLVVEPKDRMDGNCAIRHSWVHSFSPLHKSSVIFGCSNKSKTQRKVSKTSRLVDSQNHNYTPLQEEQYVQRRYTHSSDQCKSLDHRDGLILPVSGEFQDDIISKEKILEDCPSIMSYALDSTAPSSVFSVREQFGSALPDIVNENENNIGLRSNITTEPSKQSSYLNVADALSMSNKLLAFPVALLKSEQPQPKVKLSTDTEEDSMYDISYDSASDPSVHSTVMLGDSEKGSRYTMEKVGVFYVTTSETCETSFMEEFDRTMSTDAAYHSVHSLERFVVPQLQQSQTSDGIVPLQMLKSPVIARQTDLVYVGRT